MVNDITALRGDPSMADVAAESGCFVVLMHMLGTPRTMQTAPRYADVVDDLKSFFEERIEFATSRGIARDRILVDPGIGFGKTVEHNLELLRRLNEFGSLGCAILVGTSRKSFIGTVLGLPVDDRLEGTAGSAACAVMNGARVIRVHDVKQMTRVVRMVDAVLGRNSTTVTR
jgi:dihydropteroate synthase